MLQQSSSNTLQTVLQIRGAEEEEAIPTIIVDESNTQTTDHLIWPMDQPNPLGQSDGSTQLG